VHVPRTHADEASAPQAPHTSPAGAPIRLVVDLNRCEAYAQCCFLAPSVFELHGEEALWYDPAPGNAERERVLHAVASCPVQAIRVEEDWHAPDAQSAPPDARSRR
jgi:ferredoxin